MSNFGLPNQVLSDMGTQYTSEVVDQLVLMMGVEKLDTLPGSHEENSTVEREVKKSVNT